MTFPICTSPNLPCQLKPSPREEAVLAAPCAAGARPILHRMTLLPVVCPSARFFIVNRDFTRACETQNSYASNDPCVGLGDIGRNIELLRCWLEGQSHWAKGNNPLDKGS